MVNQFYQLGGQGFGSGPASAISSPRDPVDNIDIISPDASPYQLGQFWRNTTSGSVFQFVGGGQWSLVSVSGADPIESIITDSGTAIANPVTGALTLLGGTGVNTIATAASTITINVTGFGSEYTTVTANTAMAKNQGYITNKAGTAAAMSLPAGVVVAVGSSISIIGSGATGWTVNQTGTQSINFNSVSTTPGAGGSLASSARYNCVDLVCTVADSGANDGVWTVVASEGTITVT